MTQTDAARILKVPIYRMSRIELGREVPSEDVLRRMEELYGVQYAPESPDDGRREGRTDR